MSKDIMLLNNKLQTLVLSGEVSQDDTQRLLKLLKRLDHASKVKDHKLIKKLVDEICKVLIKLFEE